MQYLFTTYLRYKMYKVIMSKLAAGFKHLGFNGTIINVLKNNQHYATEQHRMLQIVFKIGTRMHSSRMRTARLLPVSPGMHCSGGYLVPGGCTLCQGVYWSGCVPGLWGTWSKGGVPGLGVCLVWGGAPGPRGTPGPGGSVPTQVLPPPRGQNHRRLWKYNLAPTSLRVVKSYIYYRIELKDAMFLMNMWKADFQHVILIWLCIHVRLCNEHQ